jgi:hypothetical protein
MKSKTFVAEEEAKRHEIEQQKQGPSQMVIGGGPKTTFEQTKAWLSERSRKAAKLRLTEAARYGTIQAGDPLKFAPKVQPEKPAEMGDVVEDKGYLGNKIVQRIKRIVGV